MDDLQKQSNNIVSISNSVGLVMPDNTLPSDIPLKNTRYEQLLYKIVSGMHKVDAYLALYHNCKSKDAAVKGVCRILRRPEVKNRLKYLLANTYTRDNVVLDRKKSKNPESRDPDGKIDIKTRKGRLAVVELVIQDYLDGGSLRTEAVLKAVESLVKLHGDQEALERERGEVPVEKIIAHLIKCEIAGVEPYNIDVERVPELVCKIFKVDYCMIIHDNNTCMFGNDSITGSNEEGKKDDKLHKGEESADNKSKVCDIKDTNNSHGISDSIDNSLNHSSDDQDINNGIHSNSILKPTQPVEPEQLTTNSDNNPDNNEIPSMVKTPINELQGADIPKGIPTQGVDSATAFEGRSGVKNEDERQPTQIGEYEGAHLTETSSSCVVPEEEYNKWLRGEER